MKISILSMQRVVNFGSVLQAWSLRQMLQQLTDEPVTFTDISQDGVLPSRKTVRESADYEVKADYPPGLLQKAKRRRITQLSAKNKRLIRQFMQQELGLDQPPEAKPDVVVVGSDEVFNHAKGVNLQLHGKLSAAKKFTYAASCGSALAEDIDQEDLPLVREAMAGFSAVSVRDEATAAYVKKLYRGPLLTHLDPVLAGPLHSRTPQPVGLHKYLLVYAYGQRIRTRREIEAIQNFAHARGLKTVAMGGSQFWCDRYIPATPFRLMDYFHYADYVVTDTFHGAVFSVLHKRPFGVITRKTNENKILGLLSQLSLTDRQISTPEQLEQVLLKPVDYRAVDDVLAQGRQDAMAYLAQQLGKKTVPLAARKASCAGCGLCAAVCPKQAISMEPDEEGFLYPVIDYKKCIGCGRCLQCCSFEKPDTAAPQAAYAAFGCPESLVKDSASGGVFATLAHACVAGGGMVAGAVMDEKTLRVRHILSDTQADIARMQGSKYVQSEAYTCYEAVSQALKSGKTVLFSGTPCQVAAVKKLTGDPENLVTMDLVCHGVPSGQMLQQFAQLLSKRLGGRITGIRFRDKSCPKPFTAAIYTCKRGKEKIHRLRSHYLSFYQYFLAGYIYRHSCYSCPYAGQSRISDLTVGDYWGIEKHHGKDVESGRMPERKDWSCVLVNTQKGAAFLQQQGSQLALFDTQLPWIAEENAQLRQPSQITPQRETLMTLYRQKGYAGVEKDFIRNAGGRLRFYRRMVRDLRSHQK